MIALRLAWLESKLLIREPVTLVFTLVFPVINVLVMGGMFAEAEEGYYRDAVPIDYYTGAYVGLVIAALGIIALPTHIATYRERGISRRFDASSISKSTILTAHTIVLLGLAAVGAILVVLIGVGVWDAGMPHSWDGVLVAFVLGALAFSMIGALLGQALPSSRATLGLGIILWFVMLILGGAGPPPEVLPEAMNAVGSFTPLDHVVLLIQDPWLGFGWSWAETLVVLGFAVGSLGLVALVHRIRSTR